MASKIAFLKVTGTSGLISSAEVSHHMATLFQTTRLRTRLVSLAEDGSWARAMQGSEVDGGYLRMARDSKDGWPG